MFKIIRLILVVVILLWVVTIPVSKKARPGSLVYSVKVFVTEPVQTWVRLTRAGKSEQLAQQLESRYREILQAYDSGEDWQLAGALKAEAATYARVQDSLIGASNESEAKPAYVLAAKSLGLVRGYTQAFSALLQQQTAVANAPSLTVFAKRAQELDTELVRLGSVLRGGTDKQNLVKGVDEQLAAMRADVATVTAEYAAVSAQLPDVQRLSFSVALEGMRTRAAAAAEFLAKDMYADSYKLSARVQGEVAALRAVILVRGTHAVVIYPVAWSAAQY